MNSSHWSIEAV
jgi:hypothetical protein